MRESENDVTRSSRLTTDKEDRTDYCVAEWKRLIEMHGRTDTHFKTRLGFGRR